MNPLTSGYLEKHFAYSEGRAPLNVVIAYDGMASAQHALDILGQLSPRCAGGVTNLCASTWWFKFLEDPDLRAKATAAAAKADMLVIAANRRLGLPNGVEAWLETSLAKKRRPEFAVVALLDKEDRGDESDSPWFQFVRRITREAGAYFFSPFARKGYVSRLAQLT